MTVTTDGLSLLKSGFKIPKIKIVLLDLNSKLCQEWKNNINDFNSTIYSTENDLEWLGVPVELKVHQGTFESFSESLPNDRIEIYNPSATNFTQFTRNIKSSKSQGVTTIVSPGNSLGYLGGGFDKAIAEIFTTDSDWKSTERYLQKKLLNRFNGYLTPSNANLIEFNSQEYYEKSKSWNLLRCNSILHLPTMRIPKPLLISEFSNSNSNNDYKIIQNYYKDTDLRKWLGFVFDCTWEILSTVNLANLKVLKWKDDRHAIIDTIIIPGIGTGYGNLPMDTVAKAMISAITIFLNCKLISLEKSIYSLRFLGEDFKQLIKDDELNDKLNLEKPNSVLPGPSNGTYNPLIDSLKVLYE